MIKCFYRQGVRAGGGIGDEIESPDGDEYEVYRILFDITFFFFIIVILLAIIQGTLRPAVRGQSRLSAIYCRRFDHRRFRRAS